MNFLDLKQEVIDCIDAGIAVELKSSPGRGKSEFADALVEHLSKRDGKPWGKAELMLATQTPPDLVGYQFKGEIEWQGRTVAVTEPTLPLWMITTDGQPVWAYERGLLILDEYGQGETDVKRASAELLLKGRLGKFALPPGWGVIAMSNFVTDRSGVTKELDFVINRRAEFTITDDINAWTHWATDAGVQPLIVAFANQHPEIVFTKGVPDKQGPWCTPRSLVRAGKLLGVKALHNNRQTPDDPVTQETVAGIIGVAAASALFAFVKLEREMPSFERIVAAPEEAKVPKAADAQMLICYNLAHRVDDKTAKPVIKYVERLGKEFSVTFAKSACQRMPTLVMNPAFQEWAKNNSSMMATLQALQSR